MISVFQPTVGWQEAWAVAKVLRSKWIGRGKYAEQFLNSWATHIKTNPVNLVAMNTCTEALFQLISLCTNEGDEVIVPAVHFIGAGNAVRGQKRELILCDVHPSTLVATDYMIEAALTQNTKAVLLLHYGGIPNPSIVKIVELCKSRGITLIEDAACSPVSALRGQAIGAFGDAGCWSFDAMKVLCSGNAGMAWVRDTNAVPSLRKQVNLGLKSGGMKSSQQRWWEYNVSEYGRMSEMDDITAAILLQQMRRLPKLISRRKGVCAEYDAALGEYDWLSPRPACCGDDSYYFYWVQTPYRDRLAQYLRAHDVYTTFRYYPLHWAYRMNKRFPGAEKAADTTLLLPCHANLNKKDVGVVCDLIRRFGKSL